MSDADVSGELTEFVKSAYEKSEPLRIRGSGSKFFYGRPTVATVLDVSENTGIVDYEPSELVVTARAGTKLSVIMNTLSESNQMLGFEPPLFGPDATLGGTVACGFSGPRRPFCGSVRDFVLGVKCINGKGEFLSFGGRVIKNVAGYDVSRLMTGALGSLGILCEISLKVLPQPETEVTQVLKMDEQSACDRMNKLTGQFLPISGASYCEGLLRIRLSGTENGVRFAQTVIGGDLNEDTPRYWEQLREHTLDFFNQDQSLWRLSVPPTSAPLNLAADCLIDWAGALRWIYNDQSAEEVFQIAEQRGGHATMFRPYRHWAGNYFSNLSDPVLRIHKNLKASFDPKNILNPGIMFHHV